MPRKHPTVVVEAAQMWPRMVFDLNDRGTIEQMLGQPGVYVLFRDDEPYYVGKTGGKLFHRIRRHATKTAGRYYHFWNYFSAFVVPNPEHRNEIEGVLIASMPTVNSAVPKIQRIDLPRKITKLMKEIRNKAVALDE